MAGKSIINQRIIGRVAGAFEVGASQAAAARAAEISHPTLKRWLGRGRDDERNGVDSIFAELVRVSRAAQSAWESRLIGTINKAAIDGDDWRAALTLLERRRPLEWGKDAPPEQPIDDMSAEDSAADNSTGDRKQSMLERVRRSLGRA